MRRLFLPLICFMTLSVPCMAEAFLSNALGQNLGVIPALTGTGYEGERTDDSLVIYLDGNPIRTRTETDDGYTVKYGDTVETVTLDENGVRTSWSISEPGRDESHTYFYDDSGRLSSVSISVDGVLLRRVEYLDTPSGTLSGITGTSDSYISPSFYLYEMDGKAVKFTYHSNGRVIREDLSDQASSYELSDDGSWRESRTLPDGTVIERVYSHDGRLVEEASGSSVTSYEYDESGDLILSVVIDGEEEVRTHYEDGKTVMIEFLAGGEILRTRSFPDSGYIEEIRYRDGNPEYSILFEGDGVRVREIHRL